MDISGDEHLFFKAFPIEVVIIRGTVVDEEGKLTLEDEGLYAEMIFAAQGAKNADGMVIAQVKCLAERDSLDPRKVKAPGLLVDAGYQISAKLKMMGKQLFSEFSQLIDQEAII